MGGAMSNPFEFREVMKASMRFNETRTVEQVLAEHERRQESRSNRGTRTTTSPSRKRAGAKAPAPEPKAPTAGQLSALDSLLQRAQAAKEAKKG